MTMRKFAVALALAGTALASPAFAHDKAWYIGVEAGPNLLQNQSFRVTSATGAISNGALTARHNIGYAVGGTIGYDFGPIRAEFEVGYKDNGLDRLNVNGALPALRLGNGTLGVAAAGPYDNAGGSSRALSFMGNLLADFGGKGNDIGGILGGGVGIARVQNSNYAFVNNAPAFLSDSDTGFAWQVLAGVYKPVTDHVDLGLKYRLFNVSNVDTVTTNGLATRSNYRAHSLMFTITYNFFEPEAAAPPPPPPAPPAPAPVAAPLPPCPPAAVTPGPFLVFFDWDKSLITAEASAILDRAAEQYAATGQTSVQLAGHADKSGKDDYNVRLSQRRADAVKAYLATKGVPDGSIVTEAFGESRPLVDTADGVREPQNRRVEITFSGAPAPATGPCTPQ